MAQRDLVKCLTFLTLRNIAGFANRQNDVLFSYRGLDDNSPSPPCMHVVYFPGDVQNYHEVMVNHPQNRKWTRWSYENTSALLHRRFTKSYVWLVVPSRIHDGTFSCYDNFLPSNMFGAPSVGSEDFRGLSHLRGLLHSAVKAVDSQGRLPIKVPLISTDVPLVAVGFSKGCVVLNQLFMHELEAAAGRGDPDLTDFLRLTSALYWLDAGHSLTSGVWITEEKLLRRLGGLGAKIRVHVSPRQVQDPVRPHIGEEERIFVDSLKQLGADIVETLHFADEERSMEQHFRVLDAF